MKASSVGRVRASLAVGASLLAIGAVQPALAQLACPGGGAGPLCIVDNSGTTGAIVGTPGTATIIINNGRITGTPAIDQSGSFMLSLTNGQSGVIEGEAGTAVVANPALAVLMSNAGTINGDVIVNDAPAPNIFSASIISYISDGGTLDGDLKLGTTGFSTAYFLQRGADDGVMGTLSAGAGIDVYAKSYDQTQSVALGHYARPADFEVEGYEILGRDKTLTLTGSGASTTLAGDGHVVNEAEIDLIDMTGLFPLGVEFVPAAISYYQPQVASFRRAQVPLGQPGSYYTQTYGGALSSFTNDGVINGDVRLATASFNNRADINLKTRSSGSVIHTAADRAFLFRNSGTIEMIDNGVRVPGMDAEFNEGFSDGPNAAIRIRAALDTTDRNDARVENSGSIIGGLDMRLAARDFSFENSGAIAGLESDNHFARGLSINVGELDLVVGENPQDEFNAESASILNMATGTIDHGFIAVLNANTATVENRGRISASTREDGVAFLVEHGLLSDDDDVVPDVAEASAASLSLLNSGTIEGNLIVDGETSSVSIINSGDVTRGTIPIGLTNYQNAIYGGSSAVEVFNESDGDHVVEFTNSGTIASSERGGSALVIEVEAGDDDPGLGAAPLIGSSTVRVVNSGTISASGGSTVTPAAVLNILPAGSVLINPIAGLHVDATDVTGASTVTIENLAGGLIAAGGTVSAVTPGGYVDLEPANDAASAVAVAASGKIINITNAGRIEGGAGTDYSSASNVIFDEVYLPDRYLAGAIHTSGDEPDLGNGQAYVGSVDHVVNQASGVIIGSIDLGANDDLLENYGSITGEIRLGEGHDRLYAIGTIDGDVAMGAGNDVVVTTLANAGNRLSGLVDGGAGLGDSFIFSVTGGGRLEEMADVNLGGFEFVAIGGDGTVTSNGTSLGPVQLSTGDIVFAEGSTFNASGEYAFRGDSPLAQTFTNRGTINGSVALGEMDDTLTNYGHIAGNVDMGVGDDRLYAIGAIGGSVAMGAGNDIFVTPLAGARSRLTGTIDGGAGLGDSFIFSVTGGGSLEEMAGVNRSGFEFVAIGGDGTITSDGTSLGPVQLSTGDIVFAEGSTLNASGEYAFRGDSPLAQTFTNRGTINGSIALGDMDDTLANYGRIAGNVDMGEGNDTFIQSLLGSFDGLATGGAGEDTLIFDVTGAVYTGSIDPALRAKFTSFEIEKLVGSGTIVTEERQEIAENGELTVSEGSTINVGAGNVAIQGSETGSETLVITPAVRFTGNVDMRGGNNQFTNQGTIDGSVSFGNGSNKVANGGTITQSVAFGDGGNSFTNSGAIQGDVTFGAGDDELVLEGDWAIGGAVKGGGGTDIVQATFAPAPADDADVAILDLSGFEEIEQLNVNGGTGKIGGTATFDQIGINEGRLIGAVGSTINANVNVAPGGTFGSAGTVNGNVSVASGGILSPGASPEVMTFNGNLALAGGSITLFEFVPAPGQSDQIIINDGRLQIEDGAILNITGDRPLTPGVAYDMIVADAIEGEFTIGSWDRGAVQGFLRYTPNKLQLLGTFVAPSDSNRQVGRTVDYVNSLLIAGEADAALLAAMPSLVDGDGFASSAAFSRLNAEAYASASQLGVEQGLGLARAARSPATKSSRQEAGMFSYAQGLGDWRTLKARGMSGVARARNHSSGLLGGIGYGSQASSLSVFVGYLDARQRIEALNARTDADGLFAGVTGHVTTHDFTLSGTLAYDWSRAETRRSVPGSATVAAHYDLDSLVLDASASYDMAVADGWMLQPAIGITHISTKRGRAVETGSAVFALNVDGKRTDATFLDGGIGLRANEKAVVQPWAQVGVRYQLAGKATSAIGSFAGATNGFNILGAARKETVATLAGGLAARLAPRLRVHAAYSGEFGGGTGSHVNIGLRYAF